MHPTIAVIANRGPNDFVWQEGAWVTRPASGGLVSMLEPLARRPDVVWFCCVSAPPDAEQAREGLYTTADDETEPALHVIPVPLPARRRSPSTTPMTASRRWQRWSSVTCCWSTRWPTA